jgi:hypothetical protein
MTARTSACLSSAIMNPKEINMKKLILPAGIFLAVFAAAYQAALKLTYNGKTVSTNVKIIGGQPYVPVADVAKALNLSVVKKPGGYEMVAAGGAGPIAGSNVGKMGETIFTGNYRFDLLSIERKTEYQLKHAEAHEWTKTEAKDNMELIVANCRIKNATKAKTTLVFGKWEGNNTCIAAADEQTYIPVAYGYDVKMTEHFPDGASFLPGSAINFSLVFEVPKGTKVKDLIFTAMQYEYRMASDQKKHKPTDIRVMVNE